MVWGLPLGSTKKCCLVVVMFRGPAFRQAGRHSTRPCGLACMPEQVCSGSFFIKIHWILIAAHHSVTPPLHSTSPYISMQFLIQNLSCI